VGDSKEVKNKIPLRIYEDLELPCPVCSLPSQTSRHLGSVDHGSHMSYVSGRALVSMAKEFAHSGFSFYV
jgi:hypothetical protein